MELGRVGVWLARDRWEGVAVEKVAEVAVALERLGFGTLWMSAGFGSRLPEPFAACLAATSRLVVATGIVSVWHVPAGELAADTAAIEAAHPGRFLLGLGSSHSPVVESLGARYEHPFSRMVDYLDALDRADPPVSRARRVLAALGPRMLRLAAERSVGAHPYFVPVEHTARARTALGAGPLLAPEQAVVLEHDPARAREIARQHTQRYLRLPNYTNNLRRLGFDDDDLAGGGSDLLVDAVIAWGDTGAIGRRIREHLDAGADHVCLQVLTDVGARVPIEQFEQLASVAAD